MNLGADFGDSLVLIEEGNLELFGMNVDVYPARIDFQTQIDEWMMALGEKLCVDVLDASLDRTRFHQAVIDEKQEDSLLPIVLCVTKPARYIEAQRWTTEKKPDLYDVCAI